MRHRPHTDSRTGPSSEGTGFSGYLRAFAILAVVLLPLAACGGDYPQSTIDPRTTYADLIQSLYVNIFWWTVVIGALVWVLLGYIMVRFRERPGQPKPKQTHGNLGLEIGWTIGPALIVVAIAIPTIRTVFATQTEPAPEENALVVDVIGHRFWWEFQYPESGVTTANELHLPVDRPVSLRMHSTDVIHSFWVPLLGGKRDVNPMVATPEGVDPRYTWLHFTPRETEVYMGQCAEFCGESHSLMGVRVVVQSEDDFEAWEDRWLNPEYSVAQSGQAPPPADPPQAGAAAGNPANAAPPAAPAMTAQEELIDRGRQVFFQETYCVLCHAINGTGAAGNLGPNLTNFGARSTLAAGLLENTRENLVRWIRNPDAIKPGVHMPGASISAPRIGADPGAVWEPTNLDDEQLEALAAYLSSLDGEG